MKPKICRYFLFLFCFYNVVPVSGKVELKPDDPFVYIGDILELNCTCDAEADRLLFFRGNDEPIDNQFLHKLNNSTIRLSIPITENDKDTHTYYCALEDFSDIGAQNLKIEYRPRPVENFTCQIYNWDELTCTWDLGPYKRLDEIYVYVKYEHAKIPITIKAENKSGFTVNCMFLSYNFTVTVSHNQTGEQVVNVSQTYIRTNISVKPPAVSNLEIISDENQCVTLQYDHELYHKSNRNISNSIRNLRIRVTYSSKWELQPWVVEKDLNNDTKVCNVHPYSEYKFDVDVLPIDYVGVWSSVKSVEYKTKATLPGSGPISTNGSYSQSLCYNGKRRVTIFFQHVPERLSHGDMKNVTAVYTPVFKGQQLSITEDIDALFGIDYNIKCSVDYLVELKATNNIGTSFNNTFVYIPKQEPVPSERDATLLITVKLDNDTGNKDVIAAWSGFISQPVNYKIFWCKSSTTTCRSDINWIEVKGDVTTKVIPSELLNIDDIEARKYIFSISGVYEGNITTPMIFANCIYQSWTVPKNPPELKLDEKNPVRSLRVSWKYDTCDFQSLVYVQSFNIYHCTTDKNGNCTAQYKKETIDSRMNNYQLTDLKAQTNYSVWMQPVSPGGLGPESDKIYGIPSESDVYGASEIFGIIFGILVLMSFIILIITRLCCRQCWKDCSKKYLIKTIKIKENVKSAYEYEDIDYYDNDIQSSEEQIETTETPNLRTQISEDSGTFSLPHSPSVIDHPPGREPLPSITEEDSSNPKIMARSISEMFNERPNGQQLTNKISIEMKTVNNDVKKQNSLLSGIPMNNHFQTPGGNSMACLPSKAILSGKPAISNANNILYLPNNPPTSTNHPPPPQPSSINRDSMSSSSATSQSTSSDDDVVSSYSKVTQISENSNQSHPSTEKTNDALQSGYVDPSTLNNLQTPQQQHQNSNVDSKSSSSASSSESQNTSSEGDSAPVYTKFADLNSNPSEPSSEETQESLQPPQEMMKLDNACSSNNKPTTDYVDPSTLTNSQFQQTQLQHQKSNVDSKSSSSASSSESQNTSSDGDSAPVYTKFVDLNSNPSQPSSEETQESSQPPQEMMKLDNACSSNNKPTTDYVDPSTLNNFQPQTSHNGESSI